MNNVSLIGRIATDAKIGNGVLTSLLAVKRIYNSKDGIDADFVPIAVFGHQAANFSKMVRKGSRIGIDGSIKTSKYADQNGEIKYGFTVAVSHFYLLDDKPKNNQQVAASKQAEVTVSDNELPF